MNCEEFEMILADAIGGELADADRAGLAYGILLSLDAPPTAEMTRQQWLEEIAAQQVMIANGDALMLDRRESVEQARQELEEHRRRKS